MLVIQRRPDFRVAPWRAAEIHIGTSHHACTGANGRPRQDADRTTQRANTRTCRRACGSAAGGTIGFARAAGCDSQDHGSRADQCTRFRRISGFRS